MDNKRRDRRIKNRAIVYYKIIGENELDRVKEEIDGHIEPEDSFSFFASLNNLDSSFGDLNKAFVLMMKEMDAKLNYIIDLLRDGLSSEFDGFIKSYTCDLSSYGLSFMCDNDIRDGDFVFIKLFLPIASHYAIKVIGRVVRIEREDKGCCVGIDFEKITAADREIIIHYMIYVERKLAKSRLNEQ